MRAAATYDCFKEKYREECDMVWLIEGWNGTDQILECSIPGDMSESEVLEILKRLVARHLTSEEIVDSSLRRGRQNRLQLLDRIGSGLPIQVGENPYFIARRRDG